MTKTVRIISQRLDGTPRDDFESALIGLTPSYLCVRTAAGTPIHGFRDGSWIIEQAPNTAPELYFFDRWYNVLHIHESGPPYFNRWYANVSLPAELDGETLRWTDLDIDVRCTDAGEIVVLDEDDFERTRQRIDVPHEIVTEVFAARDEILRLGRAGAPPFDHVRQVGRSL